MIPTVRPVWLGLGLCLLAVAVLLLGISVGSEGLDTYGWDWLMGQAVPEAQAMVGQIVREIRLPRTLGAWTAGALLGLAGAVAQGLFRNPLADPYLLGSASGASFGVAIALLGMGGGAGMLSGSRAWDGGTAVTWLSSSLWVRWGLTGAAFAGAVLAVLLTLALARGVGHTLRLLLAGVVVGVVLGAATSLALVLSPDSLQAMQAFMLGSTAFVGWSSWTVMAVVWCGCVGVAWSMARVLDGLSLGEHTARSLGLPLGPLRVALVGVLALATGTAVAQTGLVAFVGLAAPHLVRAVTRVPHRQLMWLASGMGGALLGAADVLARGLMAPQELPVGVLTAVLGGGYLLWLMQRRSGGGAVEIQS